MINTLQGVSVHSMRGNHGILLLWLTTTLVLWGWWKTRNHFCRKRTRIFKSKDFGATWTAVNAQGLRVGSRFLHDFYKSGSNFLLAYDEIGVAYSSDNCKHWNYTLSGFPPASTMITPWMFQEAHCSVVPIAMECIKQQMMEQHGLKSEPRIMTIHFQTEIFFCSEISSNIILAGACGFGFVPLWLIMAQPGLTSQAVYHHKPEQDSCVSIPLHKHHQIFLWRPIRTFIIPQIMVYHGAHPT